MDAILELLSRRVEQLLGRKSGPLHFRLLMMPTVVTLSRNPGRREGAREGQPAFLWAIITNPAERGRLVRSAMKDVGRIFIVAVVLDTVYQVFVLRTLHVVQLLIVAIACAIVPYVLIRGPVTRLARLFHGNQTRFARDSASEATLHARNPD